MQPFLHQHLQRFERLLESSNQAMRAYNDLDLEAATLVDGFLEQAATEYAEMGTAEGENEMLALRAQLTSARRGVDPTTLERTTGRRRELERSVALRVLLLSAERLRRDHTQTRQRLLDTREQLSPITLYALQKGYLVLDPDRAVTQSELEQVWASVLDDPESQATARHVAMAVSSYDILLLLADLLEALG